MHINTVRRRFQILQCQFFEFCVLLLYCTIVANNYVKHRPIFELYLNTVNSFAFAITRLCVSVQLQNEATF